MIEKDWVEDFVDLYLENNTLEDLLEQFNITPLEAIQCMFDSGLLDEELLKELARTTEIDDGSD